MNRLDVARDANVWLRALDPDRTKIRARTRRGPYCDDHCPVPPFLCSLPPGHEGRHVAIAPMRGAVAAWPGWHRPVGEIT